MTTHTLKTKHLISKSLFKKIDEVVTTYDNNFIKWNDPGQRLLMRSMIDHHLQEYEEQGLLTRGYAICNMQNNTVEDMNNGLFTLTIKYCQAQCLVDTQLDYQFEDLRFDDYGMEFSF